jgi:ketosteroid isomerase-like protein
MVGGTPGRYIGNGWVVGLEKVRGKMKDGQDFAWTALGTNIYKKRDCKWLIVHHHASKATEELVVVPHSLLIRSR